MNTPQEFAPLMAALRRLEARRFAGGAALATLTRTRGSTFRRPGARMLVCGDGEVVRGLSGGCPEADIIARSHEVIAAGEARIVRYDREHGLDALIELGCGGELEVLIEPLRDAADLHFATAVERCLVARNAGFLATAYLRDGRVLSPRPRRLVWNGHITSDDLDDRALVEPILQAAAGAQQPVVTRVGATDVLIERLQAPHALVVVGVNAGAVALARIGAQLGWLPTIVDHRDDRPGPVDLPAGVELVRALPEQLAQRVTLDARTSAVVMTHNLERDRDYLRVLGAAPLAYLGAIGSRQRAEKLRGAAPHLRAPAGLDVGSETPEEIALAIAAEILAVTSGHRGGFLSAEHGPIH